MRKVWLANLLVGMTVLAVPAVPVLAQQVKSVAVVPKAGPLANETVYTNSFAVIIGVGKYANLPKDKHLEYAVKDATDLKSVLVQSYGFLSENVILLTDAQATKHGIEEALASLGNGKRIKSTDRVLVFFSGHGQTVARPGGGDTGFLIPFDAKVELDDPERRDGYSSSCLRMENIWGYLEDCPARHRLLLVDSCFGGLIFRTKSAANRPSPAVVKGLLSRPALQAITAGGKGEEALEDAKLGNSAFTFKLLEELRALAASPGEILTASELGTALKNSVSNLTNAKQTPQFGNYGGTEGEFLFVSAGNTDTSPAVAVAKPNPDAIGGNGRVVNTKARLKVTTNAPNAVITVDGKVAKDGEFTANLLDEETKSFQVKVTAPGYEGQIVTATLERGKLLPFPVTLETLALSEPVPHPRPLP